MCKYSYFSRFCVFSNISLCLVHGTKEDKKRITMVDISQLLSVSDFSSYPESKLPSYNIFVEMARTSTEERSPAAAHSKTYSKISLKVSTLPFRKDSDLLSMLA